jgi:hypothetical protein
MLATKHGGAHMEFLIIYLIAGLVGLAISYVVIRAAVRAALFDHYKSVRLHERTGEWYAGSWSHKVAPRAFETTGAAK